MLVAAALDTGTDVVDRHVAPIGDGLFAATARRSVSPNELRRSTPAFVDGARTFDARAPSAHPLHRFLFTHPQRHEPRVLPASSIALACAIAPG